MAKILVIEDDPGVRRVLLCSLQNAGHDVHSAENGRDGLRSIAEREPDVVVTDIVMPDSDGLEVIRLLKGAHPRVRIIAISGGGMICGATYLDLARMLGAGITLQKPVLPSDLVFAVDELLREGTLPSGAGRAGRPS